MDANSGSDNGSQRELGLLAVLQEEEQEWASSDQEFAAVPQEMVNSLKTLSKRPRSESA